MINEFYVDKYENLPFRESRKEFLTRKYGNLYSLSKFDHRWHRSNKSDYAWVKVDRVIKKFIGKQFDKAFSYYCTISPINEQIEFFEPFKGRWRNLAEYVIDKQGRIQRGKELILWNKKRKEERDSKGFWFYSIDYQEGYMHKISKEVIDKRTYQNNSYSRYGNDPYRIYFRDEDYIKVIINGFSKHFKSKKDREFIRLKKEKYKQYLLYKKKCQN